MLVRSEPHVTIALCTYNGDRYLHEQLQSYLAQTHQNWSLWVSDDGSTDKTRGVLEAFRRDHGHAHKIRIMNGPRSAAAQNFLSILSNPAFPTSYVALSDQDDVWLPDKLSRGISQLESEKASDAGRPLLYGAQSLHVDSELKLIGRSRSAHAKPAFHSALVQNVISGHSAILCPSALELVRRAGVPEGIPFHDWWIYQLVTGSGGRVIIDPRPVLLYRQHESNVMGANQGLREWLHRVRVVWRSDYARWTAANVDALLACGDLLTPEARAALHTLRAGSGRWGPSRASLFLSLGLRRQTWMGTIALYLAAFLGRV